MTIFSSIQHILRRRLENVRTRLFKRTHKEPLTTSPKPLLYSQRSQASARPRSRSLIHAWKTRVLRGFDERDFKNQVALYSAHKSRRDYIYNALGQLAQGLMFPLLTIVVTQISGLASAGQFSFCFVVAQLLGFIGLFGVRTYQVSDIEELESFAAYQVHRVITCLIMLIVSAIYLLLRHDTADITWMCASLVGAKCVEALADVFEGRLQQYDKLYLAGISQAIRTLFPILVFVAALVVSKHAAIACVALLLSSICCLVLVTFPLTKFETPASRPWSAAEIKDLCIECMPTFLGLFLYCIIDSVPRLIMEAVLGFEQQFFYNALSFPAMAILLVGGLIYKPRLVKLSLIWTQEKDTRAFDKACVVITLALLLASAVLFVIVAKLGIWVNEVLYGVSFSAYALEQNVLVVAGICALFVDFVFQLLTIVRAQARALVAYSVSLVVECVFVSIGTFIWGFSGCVWAFAASCAVLLAGTIAQYIKSRKTRL